MPGTTPCSTLRAARRLPTGTTSSLQLQQAPSYRRRALALAGAARRVWVLNTALLRIGPPLSNTTTSSRADMGLALLHPPAFRHSVPTVRVATPISSPRASTTAGVARSRRGTHLLGTPTI